MYKMIKKGIARKQKRDRTKHTVHPTDPTPFISITNKQKEVLHMLNDGLNFSQIARKLDIFKSSLQSRMKGLENKKLILHPFGLYQISKLGKKVLESVGLGSTVCLPKTKSIHANSFTVLIKEFPRQWHGYSGNDFKNKLECKSYLYDRHSKMYFLYYDDCTIRVTSTTKKMTFFVKEKEGYSFDKIKLDVWGCFVDHYFLITGHGFKLDSVVDSKNPDFANPDGLFAKMSSYLTQKGFKIDTDKGSFWVDYSPPSHRAEEETTSEEIAARMENLAASAIHSNADFKDLDNSIVDLDKLKEIVVKLTICTSNLVQSQTNMNVNNNISEIDISKQRVDYVG